MHKVGEYNKRSGCYVIRHFLGEPFQLPMTHLTLIHTFREWLPATLFAQLGSDADWDGHLAQVEPTKSCPWNWAN